jgi:RNA polymerase sigma-70 factor, ECF subfamily
LREEVSGRKPSRTKARRCKQRLYGAFFFQKFLNRTDRPAVFMIEGRPVAAGEAILNGAATTGRNESERRRIGRRDEDRTDKAPRDAARDSAEHTSEAVEALVRQHSRLVYRIAYAALRSHHDAEDATQETFLRVLRYSARLAAVDDPKTWLARIAWRVAGDRGKRRGRTREIPLENGDPEKAIAEPASSDATADTVVHGAQIGAALEKLIAALPEKLRQPLVLSTIEEMSPREVAATLGINEAAVRSRVFRARQILREKLEPRIGRK